jgi:hypothetical protein
MNSSEDLLGIRETRKDDAIRTEQYHQIMPHVVKAFPEERYPLNLYYWKDAIQALAPVYKAGRDVDEVFTKNMLNLSEKGMLFFCRDQIELYMKYAVTDFESALSDPNLTWGDVAGLLVDELGDKQNTFFKSPLESHLQELTETIDALCEYLIEDTSRLGGLVAYVHDCVSEERRFLNGSLISLAVYIEMNRGMLIFEALRKVALGFFLYDIGMTRLPAMTMAKPQQLGAVDSRGMKEHIQKGLDLAQKFGLNSREVTEPILQHHERLDGSGYPKKLSGDDVGELGRVVSVVDSYCAMITATKRRQSKTSIEATAELIRFERKYDQSVVQILVRLLKSVHR